MGPLLLLGFSILLARSALAEVAPNFNNCKQFFYKSQEPTWFPGGDIKKICQKHNDNYYYATLYNTVYRNAFWSAYTLYKGACPNQAVRRNVWFVEPQLSAPAAPGNMKTETATTVNAGLLKQYQAISIDYEDTTYDRGHLNPNSFQCNINQQLGRDATFTLTNAVPMDPCFNRIRWAKLEKTLKDQLSTSCPGTAYLLTGSVPNPAEKIPNPVYDSESDRNRDYRRVVIPSHIWTAVCCDNSNENLKFSFGFLAENKEESLLRILPVEQLEAVLKDHYGLPHNQPFKLFANYCNPKSKRGEVVLDKINNAIFQGFRDMIENYYVLLFPQEEKKTLDKGTKAVTTSMQVDNSTLQLTGAKFTVAFPTLSDWYQHSLNLSSQDNLTCVISSIRGISRVRRDTKTPPPIACTLQEEKQIDDSSVSAKGWRCVWQNCGKHGGTSYSWCSTSYNHDWDYCCTGKCAFDSKKDGHFCRSGDKAVPCSPLYSSVAVTGEPCRPDHPCGLYEESYYWCYTDYKDNWEYCCAPRHFCDKHSSDYSNNWCYVDDPHSKHRDCRI